MLFPALTRWPIAEAVRWIRLRQITTILPAASAGR
jgi:hypothetical protein